MASILGFGTHLPYYRLKLDEIANAWNRPLRRGEKTVPARDEDVITLGVKAAQRALAHAGLPSEKLGAVYAGSLSSGYRENALAAQIAYTLGAEGDLTCADLGLSARAVTTAIQLCADALACGRIAYGLVVACDALRAKPGSDAEWTSAAGAASCVLGTDPGLAEILGITSHSTGFVGRFCVEGGSPVLDDERFVMRWGFIEHVQRAVQTLWDKTRLTVRDYDRVVLPAPDPRWPSRLLPKLGLTPDKLISTGMQIGYAGCASWLIDLAAALESSEPGQKILALSFGPGGSDALALSVRLAKPPAKTVTEQLGEKEYISYTQYLRFTEQL